MLYSKIFLIPLMSAFILSCDRKTSYEQSLPLEKTFRMSIVTEPPTVDWTRATDATSAMLIDNIMSGLITYDFSDKSQLNYKPDLAQSIKSKNNGSTWIIRLREDIYWSDGVPLTGQHVIDSWERLLNPKTGAAYAYSLYHIKNAKEYNTKEITDFSKVGVKLTPDGSIQVDLTGPKYYFPYILTHTSTYPIRKDIVDKHQNEWTKPENIVTLGSYLLDKWEHDKVVVLKKNPSYFGKMPGNAENIVIQIIPELSTSINLFESKKLDFLNAIPSDQLPYFKKREEFFLQDTFITYYYGFNTEKPPLDNVTVRKAISMAIDRNAIAQILHGTTTPLRGWVPKGLFGHDPDIGLPYDPKKAKELFDSVPKPLPKITLSFNTFETHKRVAETVQAQLKKNLGLEIEVMSEEWKFYLENMRLGKSMMYRMGWLPDYPDPHDFMHLMTSYSENNYTRFKSPTYDSLVERAGVLKNGAQRMRLYSQAQRLMIEENALVIPIHISKESSLVSKRVKFYPHNVMRRFIFKEIVLN